jgi:hypothetical protein
MSGTQRPTPRYEHKLDAEFMKVEGWLPECYAAEVHERLAFSGFARKRTCWRFQ